jgi:AAA domain-containing protein
VAGEGGTGKYRVIEAVKLGMQLLGREEEMFVTAPTGNAANNVQGSTIHTGLDVAVRGRKQGASRRVQALWRNKNMLVIDEISMVSSKLMDSIDQQCKVVKNLDHRCQLDGRVRWPSGCDCPWGFPSVLSSAGSRAIMRNEGSSYGICLRM